MITELNNNINNNSINIKQPLKKYFFPDNNIFEIGVDEVGRGPLFGRVYTAAVILPKDGNFDYSKMKDSKKFHSKNKIEEVSNYIKENALAWHISYETEKTIDQINILQATQHSMHDSIKQVRQKYNNELLLSSKKENTDFSYHLLIDGNYFNPFTYFDTTTNKITELPFTMVKGGDNHYASIAAASILAKVERDKYIAELCNENPTLVEYYGIDKNMGYGVKKHYDGINQHGITKWHRKSFGICKQYV